MSLDSLATELLLYIFRSCGSISDILSLASTCRRFHNVFHKSNKLLLLAEAAETEFGPLNDAIQLVTQNASQPAYLIRNASLSFALLEQIIQAGHVARKWETLYPAKKWKSDYENRRSLTSDERFRLRRAVYRLWLYHRAFHNRMYDRFSRHLRHVVLERVQLLHSWSMAELAEIENLRQIMEDVVQNHICPSNGTIQRKFRKRYPDSNNQLSFNIHLNYPSPRLYGPHMLNKTFGSAEQYYFHTAYSAHPGGVHSVPRSRFYNDQLHDSGYEGWGDEIPHYYVVQDMMKLDPSQILWLREHARLKNQVEASVFSLGEWFRNNGETFGDTLSWVAKERGEDVEELRAAITDREMGIVCT